MGDQNKQSSSLGIKQERMEANLSNDDETTCGHPMKKSKADMTDAESNTINSGKF